jgi:6-phosphogluconolactonase
MRFYIGGYDTNLNIAELDPADGSIEIVGKVTTPQNASFLRHCADLSTLYATVEAGSKTGASGKIAAYRVGSDGGLTAIGSAESCGAGPCHLDIDPERRLLTAANYGGETFSAISLKEDGTLEQPVACVRHHGKSVNPNRQAEPHPHATTFSPDRAWLFVCDLGTDRIMRYKTDALLAGSAEEPAAPEGEAAAVIAPGSGPRHITFSADARFVYLVNELSNTVTVFSYEAQTGGLEAVQELSSLPSTFDGQSTGAEIQIHPNGRFLYASNRGHDSIAVFARDTASGELEFQTTVDVTGEHPRHFQIDASGEWCLVANQFTDHVVSFHVDPGSGQLSWTGKSIQVPAPSCCEFMR